ncbi:hypothetical protein ASG29_10555 [Sphingomonas sp. Leaf412]|uniref:hypothetical protein n=1 Tax=Sphingomonas sp. Leaf412 TaxID=1736370 RepID=UPI0006FD0EDB|nr:hypothetical protein [Sphingomonas sp. Leaf412]KQT32252.1 hypothetical protein ASG29_10555 [Sphingomonas sp. Leaf412]
MVSKNVAALFMLALAACNQGAAPPDANQSAAAQAAGATAPAAAKLWNGGTEKGLDIQVAHPNGTVLQVTSVQSRATDTAVGIRIINGHQRDVQLNNFPNNRASYLLLDDGQRLYLSPPATNARLNVPKGQTFEGQLVFLGRLEPVKAAVLVLNENSSTDSEYSDSPGYRIDLPLAGVAS